MARQKKAATPAQKLSEKEQIEAFIAKNGVQKIAQNVGGNFEPKSFFGRRGKKKIAGKAVNVSSQVPAPVVKPSKIKKTTKK